MGGFRRYLAVQTVLPEAWENDRAFIRSLELLGRAGFDDVDAGEFRRYGSARKLYNFHVDNLGAY